MIVCFSGTGNSAWVAQRLSQLLGDPVTNIDRKLLDNPVLPDSERYIWVFPVHSWGIPPLVRSVIRSVKCTSGLHLMVATMGDDAGLTDAMFRKETEDAGRRFGGAWGVIMPNTYIALPGFDVDAPEVERAKLDAAPARVNAIADDIRKGRISTDIRRGTFPALKTRVIYHLFGQLGHINRFRVDAGKCVGCGKCAAACPLQNIILKDRHPVWGETCAGCLGCYHSCKSDAIVYGPFSRGKGHYLRR